LAHERRSFVALATLTATVVPVVAFAAHVNGCCGNVWCCLKHLACCN